MWFKRLRRSQPATRPSITKADLATLNSRITELENDINRHRTSEVADRERVESIYKHERSMAERRLSSLENWIKELRGLLDARNQRIDSRLDFVSDWVERLLNSRSREIEVDRLKAHQEELQEIVRTLEDRLDI
jgi:hypothetical protein